MRYVVKVNKYSHEGSHVLRYLDASFATREEAERARDQAKQVGYRIAVVEPVED